MAVSGADGEVVVVIRSADVVRQVMKRDGAVVLTYLLPRSLHFHRPHQAKLLFVSGHGGRELLCCASFVKEQFLGREPARILGTSVAQSNVYVPINGNMLPSSGYLTLSSLDGQPLTKSLGDICLAIHVTPAIYAGNNLQLSPPSTSAHRYVLNLK